MVSPIYIVLVPFFPTQDCWRGAFFYDFVQALRRTGRYDVRVFVPGAGEDYVYQGVKVYRYPACVIRGGLFPWLSEFLNRRSFLRKVRIMGIDWSQVAVCHSHEIDCLPLALAGKRRNPCIQVVHHFHAGGQPFHVAVPHLGVIPFYSTCVYLHYREYLEQVDVPVFVSEHQRRSFGFWYPQGYKFPAKEVCASLKFGSWIRPIRLRNPRVLYNGIDYSVFSPGERKSDVAGSRLVIGDVANMHEAKDQMTLLKALCRLVRMDSVWRDRLACILVGSGVCLEECQNYVAENELSDVVEFRREMDHLQLPEFYRSLDLFVSPSWIEGFCCAFIEASGCGVPIMGCNGVSVEEMFPKEERCHWLFPLRDDARLAQLIADFYETRRVPRFVQDFDIDKLVPGFVKLLGGECDCIDDVFLE